MKKKLKNGRENGILGLLQVRITVQKEDIMSRLSKAHSVFARLKPVWKLKQYNLKTTLVLYGSNVSCFMVQNTGL